MSAVLAAGKVCPSIGPLLMPPALVLLVNLEFLSRSKNHPPK